MKNEIASVSRYSDLHYETFSNNNNVIPSKQFLKRLSDSSVLIGDSSLWYLRVDGARCSSVVRAFAHGAMGCRIDPSW